MTDIKTLFANLERITKVADKNEFMTTILNIDQDNLKTFQQLSELLHNITNDIDKIALVIKTNENILISVKDQKILRTCFQVVILFGISPCLIQGLGISLTKRCASAKILPPLYLNDKQKYETLSFCTDFLHRCYNIPVLKNIILTFHLSDYLAALIQLSFAPLKKPGTYSNFTMTEEMYEILTKDRSKYLDMYEYLVTNCFQPMLMKELLVLQNGTDVTPPVFAKRIIAKEMSRRLTFPGGLLSLIRCFIESNNLDTGLEWKKIDMICRIVSTKHGNLSENDYINNVCSQLKQILSLNNAQYLTTAISCLFGLYDKYNQYEAVTKLAVNIFQPFDHISILQKSNLPGTVVFTAQEIEHNVLLLHSFINIAKFELIKYFLPRNLFILYLLRMKCSKTVTKSRIDDIILKGFEHMDRNDSFNLLEKMLFGFDQVNKGIFIEEYEGGLLIKYVTSDIEHAVDRAVQSFIEIFNSANHNKIISHLFETCLQLFIKLDNKRSFNSDRETLMNLEEEQAIINNNDEKYMNVLHLLSEISSSKKVLNILKSNPEIVVDFVEKMFSKNIDTSNDECTMIALVLLNTILANADKCHNIKHRLHHLLPHLNKIEMDESNPLSILCKETKSLILLEYPKPKDSAYEKAISDIYGDLLPVRAHGMIELTKLIDVGDPETISKKYFLFCLFQEQLKDTDSYMYLSAINAIASLAKHCTGDVIGVLCREFLNVSNEHDSIQTLESEKRISELRMKIGDVIVKVTRCLGEMAVVHKNILLNTMLCGCRDEDPLIRTSALSNLAEIVLVLHYRVGTIIYEILLCIWSIIESDKAIECRRSAVMVITSLLRGLGKEALVELKENILPIYRTLNKLHKDEDEDSVLRLHAQLALEEINEIVKQFIQVELPHEKRFVMLDNTDIKYK